MQHIVLVSSAGGCNPQHFLNHIGPGEVGRRGNILNWKRGAEQHLIASGVTYTILQPNRECCAAHWLLIALNPSRAALSFTLLVVLGCPWHALAVSRLI